MALRNISNLLRRQSLNQQQQQQEKPTNCQMYQKQPIYESHYEMVKNEHLRASMRSKSASCALPLSIPQQQQQQPQQQQCNSSAASSVQIRTSSPISTSSSCSSGPANSIISPSKFMRAAQQNYHRSHQSRSSCRRPTKSNDYYDPHCIQQQHQQQMYNPKLPHYFSMKEIAYQNLRRQQSTAKVQKLIASSSTRQEPLRSCGKLRVAAYKNSGLLTVHIIQGRHYRKLMQQIDPTDTNKLFCERIGTSDTYTTVAMLPDPDCRLKCKTAVIKDSRAPIYDDKFSFELDPLNDFNNRIVISVWRAAQTHSKPSIDNLTAELLGANTVYDELVGCFSFKIKHLVERGGFQPDWYHLLPFNYGIKKHLKCKQSEQHEQNTSDPEKHVANVNKDLVGLKKLRFAVERASEGFGFTLTGSCPCYVSKVEQDKPAARSGLKPGDFIATINNVNVSRASRETVVKLIKNTKHQLSIEVYREKANDEPRHTTTKPQVPNPYVMPLQSNYHILMTSNPNTTSSSASSSLNDYHPQNSENYYMIHQPTNINNNKYQPKSSQQQQHQENPYYESNCNYRLMVKSKNSSQSSSGVSSAYENIDREQDFSDERCFDYSTAEAVRCTQHSSIVVAKSDRDFNLPQIHLTNYQSQPQLLYGLEAVPEEDENMSEHVVSHRKEELDNVLLNENEFDDDDEDEDDDSPSPTPPLLATSHDLVSPSHLTAYGLVQSTIRYVDATTDEDEEPYALTTSQMAAQPLYKHCQQADSEQDEYNQENIEELRRVAAQYYSTSSIGCRVATKISLRNLNSK